MIFKTFNSDIDKSISKIGMFNKSFWAMQQDLKHGNGLAFSIFGGQSVTDKDKQAILNFSSDLKKDIPIQTAWARNMSNCSIAAQNQTRECLKTKGSLTELANGLKTTSVASKAAAIGLKALSIAGNMIVSFVIFKGIELIASAIDNYANRVKYAQERLDEFSNTVSVISDYANLEEIAKDKKYIISHQNERVILTEEYTKIYNEICQLK